MTRPRRNRPANTRSLPTLAPQQNVPHPNYIPPDDPRSAVGGGFAGPPPSIGSAHQPPVPPIFSTVSPPAPALRPAAGQPTPPPSFAPPGTAQGFAPGAPVPNLPQGWGGQPIGVDPNQMHALNGFGFGGPQGAAPRGPMQPVMGYGDLPNPPPMVPPMPPARPAGIGGPAAPAAPQAPQGVFGTSMNGQGWELYQYEDDYGRTVYDTRPRGTANDPTKMNARLAPADAPGAGLLRFINNVGGGQAGQQSPALDPNTAPPMAQPQQVAPPMPPQRPEDLGGSGGGGGHPMPPQRPTDLGQPAPQAQAAMPSWMDKDSAVANMLKMFGFFA